ncbi:MAG: hypothetical protein JWM27_1200 [Gemmatimonadetes bacterium]|nr:hypothetical protein [Gemmatimonadota bacterium]
MRAGVTSRVARWLRYRWRMDVRRLPSTALVLSVAAVVSGGILPSVLGSGPLGPALMGWLALPGWDILVRLQLLLLFPLFVWALVLRRSEAFDVVALTPEEVRPRQAVLIFLSLCDVPTRSSDGWEVKGVAFSGTSVRSAIAALDGARWPWQQMLRGIEPHVGHLEHVHLFGSDDSKGKEDGTWRNLPKAKEFLTEYLPGVDIHDDAPAVNFDSILGLKNVMVETIGWLGSQTGRGGRRLRPQDVILDVTGGLKPTSIAGAVVTINCGVNFQYVHTTDGRVLEYDLLHRGSASA